MNTSCCGDGAATVRSGCSVPTRPATPSFSSGYTRRAFPHCRTSTPARWSPTSTAASTFLPSLNCALSLRISSSGPATSRCCRAAHRFRIGWWEQAVSLGRDLADVPADSVVHGNLHYENVLAADREPWLVIAPKPVNGDPHYELAPMLWNRWDELSGHIRDGVRRRFYTLVDAAGFDEERARAWVVVRVIQEATRELANPTLLTKYVALAKAVQG
jgi:hypothetical protein